MKTAAQMLESFDRYQIQFSRLAEVNKSDLKRKNLAFAQVEFNEWTRKQTLAQMKLWNFLEALQYKEMLPPDLQKKESALFLAFSK